MQFKSLLTIFAALPFVFSCSNDLEEDFSEIPQSDITTNNFDQSLFPIPDKSRRIAFDPALGLRQLLLEFDESKALVMGETQITDEQFAEIKTFVDENLKAEKDIDTYHNIFKWLYANLGYVDSPDEVAYVDPYDVFIYRKCVCQGFANLLKTMCLTQKIPAMGVNGMLIPWGGHAWNYVFVDNEWYVSDATNNQQFRMAEFNKYKDKLAPQRTDLNLFENDNFCFNFDDGHLNVSEIKSGNQNYVVVPYSIGKYRVTSFKPSKKVPDNFTQLYLGANIETLGQYPNMVNQYFPNLQEVYIDEDNKKLESYKNIIYQKRSTTPYFIPASIRRVELKPMKVMDKNVIYGLDNVEEIVVAEGTERMEDYCIEACKNLRTVYVPKSVTYIAEKAIFNCNENVEIVRTSTGITEVTK